MSLPYVPINYVDYPNRRLLGHVDPTSRTDARFAPWLHAAGSPSARGVEARTNRAPREREVQARQANTRGYQAYKEAFGSALPNPVYFSKTNHNFIDQLVVEPFDNLNVEKPYIVATQFLNH